MSDTTPSDMTRLAMGLLNSSYALPGSPAMLVSRMSNENLVFTPTIVESPELETSGQPIDSIYAGGSSAGNVEFPLVRSLWFHEMLAAAFRNDWATGTLGEETSPGSGIYTTRSVAANELIPAKSIRLYKAEKQYDTPDAASYHLYDRVGVNTMSLRVQPNEIITGSVGLVGGMMSLASAPLSGATYADPGSYATMTAPNVTAVDIGAASTAQCFNSLTLNFNSNLRPIACIGRQDPKTRGLGRFQAMVEGTAYFTSNDMLVELLSQAAFAVTATLTDGSSNSYSFHYPRCKFVNAPVSTPGTNGDVMVPLSIRALYDRNRRYSVLCTRTLA